MAREEGSLAGSARLARLDGVALLRPDEQVFEAMLEGWRNQGLARNLARTTVQARERQVRAFQAHVGTFPWEWTAMHADKWFADLRAVHHCTRSTVRGYQVAAVRGFCAFTIDPAYGWAEECMRRFGSHPVQIITDVNSAQHAAVVESVPAKRPFTRRELQDLFDYADEQVEFKRSQARRGGWRRSATRRSSRLPSPTAPAAPRRRCSTSRTSAATRRLRSSAGSGRCWFGAGRPRVTRLPSDARC